MDFIDRLYHFHRWTPDFVIGELDCPTAELSGGRCDRRHVAVAFPDRTARNRAHRSSLRAAHRLARPQPRLVGRGRRRSRHRPRVSGSATYRASSPESDRPSWSCSRRFAGQPTLPLFLTTCSCRCAPITLEQLNRTSAQVEAIATDFIRLFQANANVPPPADWIFASCLLAALQKSPLTEEYDLLTRTGLHRAESVDAVILSLNAEAPVILRHRRLGYAISLHGFRIQDTSEMMRTWLTANFEPVKRTLDDVRKDLLALVDAVRARLEVKLLVLNALSTLGYEDILTYASFDRPMGDVIASVRNKELNLLLHDIARERDVAIVDVDAIAADLGAAVNLPDGIHGSGRLQAEVRGEIVRILRGCGIPGFRPRAFN